MSPGGISAHPRFETAQYQGQYRHMLLINYANAGISGWHIDLDRYGNQSDMWVDYVRVYQGAKEK